MAKRCPYRSRACPIVVPNAGEAYPAADRVAALRPVIGTIMDLAAEYDRCAADGELSTAVEFATWLQVTAEQGNGSPLAVGRSAA